MRDVNDMELVRKYADQKSEPAFAELVRRHINLVYSIALRFTHDSEDAHDVAQSVFIILARKASSMRPKTILTGWLYETTRFTALKCLRNKTRQQAREQEAYMQSTLNPSQIDEAWKQLVPHLEDAMRRLNEKERALVALRYFENKSGVETAAILDIEECAARQRIGRAVDKLRNFFIRRGIILPAAVLTAAISANAVQAAPAALAKSMAAIAFADGATTSGSTSVLIKGALKLLAWAKTKTTVAFGASILLAAGTTIVIVNSVNTSSDDIINKLERQSGKTIVWDKHIKLPATFVVQSGPLEEALDQLAVDSGAYWSVDYAVYNSKQSLRQLLTALHDGVDLQSAGWTNFSSRVLTPQLQVVRYRGSGGMRLGTNVSSEIVGMVVVLDREASAKQNQVFQKWFMQNRAAIQNGRGAAQPPDAELRTTIAQAMKDGTADGVLAPERLLADMQIIQKINFASPAPATPEAAEQMAKAAHASWTTIYTLRKSPIDGAGFKLIHAGRRTVYGDSWINRFSPEAITKRVEERQFNLTSEERAAHELKCPADQEGFFEVEGSSYMWNTILNNQPVDVGGKMFIAIRGNTTNFVPVKIDTNIIFSAESTPLLFDYDDFHPRSPKPGKNAVFMDGHVTPLKILVLDEP